MKAPAVRILDTNFNLLGEIDDYESLQFTRRFYRAGEFEMHIALGKQSVEKLQKDVVIMVGNQPHKSGIITQREIPDENGIEKLVVRGLTLGGVLDRRITMAVNYDRVRGAAETVIKHYVDNNLVNGTYATGIYAGRRIPFISIATDQQRGKQTPWQTRFEPLDKVTEEIAKWCDIGWLIKLDFATKKWVFDVLIGRDLTAGQTQRPPVIFSHEFDNIQSQQFVDSDTKYKNVAYAGGPGDEEQRLIQAIGNVSGFDRREAFLDCSSAADAVELADLGAQQLAELKRIQAFDGKILDTRSFQYEKDWDLGDIVTIRNLKWGLTMNSRITEIKEIYEPATKLEVTFGNEIPTITQAIKKVQNEVKRSG